MIKRIISLALVLLSVSLCLASCKSASTEESTDNTIVDTSSAEPEYIYPEKGSVGKDFVVLNNETMFEGNNQLDFTEAELGQKLPAAIYNRNRALEDRLGIKFTEVKHPYLYSQKAEICKTLARSVASGDDEYDIALLQISYDMSLISQGVLTDLSGIESMQLEKAWWDTSINDSLKVGNKLYAASGAMNLFMHDLVFCTYFNEVLMKEKGMEVPYQLARDGKWTLEKFEEYVVAAPDLKSAESFTYSDDSDAVYAIAGHEGSINAMLTSAGHDTVVVENGKYRLNLSTERAVNIVEQLTSIFNLSSGQAVFGQTVGKSPNCYEVFKANRAMFVTCYVSDGMLFTGMDNKYCLLPMPKYDESQKDYRHAVSWNAGAIVVPVSVQDAETVGKIVDAFNYESSKTVTPVYMEMLQYQGLQDPDSVDMFKLIMNTRTFDFGAMYGITAGSYENPCYDEAIRNAVRLNYTVSVPGLEKRFQSMLQGRLNDILAAYGIKQ